VGANLTRGTYDFGPSAALSAAGGLELLLCAAALATPAVLYFVRRAASHGDPACAQCEARCDACVDALASPCLCLDGVCWADEHDDRRGREMEMLPVCSSTAYEDADDGPHGGHGGGRARPRSAVEFAPVPSSQRVRWIEPAGRAGGRGTVRVEPVRACTTRTAAT
jgi:hypothetical protein